MPKGSCACGEFTYEIPDNPTATIVCHCRACEKFAGSNGSTNGFVPEDQYKTLSGNVRQWSRKGDSGKNVTNSYCSICSTLMTVNAEAFPGVVIFKPGTLDDKSSLDKWPVMQEMYTKNRPSCIEALEGAEQKQAAT